MNRCRALSAAAVPTPRRRLTCSCAAAAPAALWRGADTALRHIRQRRHRASTPLNVLSASSPG
eukprot:scaffold10140_cov62-Phaeocystis_antarctica.AAC.1